MWSVRVTVISSLLLLVGCLKQQPVVNAPVVMDIAPVSGKEKEPPLLPTKLGFTADFTAPADWPEDRRDARTGRVFRFTGEEDSFISVHVLPDRGKTDPDVLVTDFQEILDGNGVQVTEKLAEREPYVTMLRYCAPAHTLGEQPRCGQRVITRPSMVPDLIIVATGEWPEFVATRGWIAMDELLRTMKIVSEATLE